jgi:hypothetical protein
VHFCAEVGKLILIFFGFILLFVNTSLFFKERRDTASSALARATLIKSIC